MSERVGERAREKEDRRKESEKRLRGRECVSERRKIF